MIGSPTSLQPNQYPAGEHTAAAGPRCAPGSAAGRSAYYGAMASWQDGPEYAPSARPSAFVMPDAEPLRIDPAPARPAEPVPTDEPRFTAPEQDQPALAALAPSAAPGRNPNLPFVSQSTPLTSTEPRLPTQPFGVGGGPISGYLAPPIPQAPVHVNPAPFAAPGTPAWFAPPGAAAPSEPRRVGARQLLAGITPGVAITLAIGMLFSWAAPFTLVIAFVLSSRIGYRREAVHRTWQLTGFVLLGIAMVTLTAIGNDLESLFAALAGVCQFASWAVAITLTSIVALALHDGEQPFRFR